MADETENTPTYISFWAKCRALFTNAHLKLQLQTGTVSLVIFNYLIIYILRTNQDIEWKFPNKGRVEERDRYGQDFLPPQFVDPFGTAFYFVTILIGILAIVPVFVPRRNLRKCLVPCLVWNLYMITTVVDNCMALLLAMYVTNVPFGYMLNVFVVGFVVTYLQIKFSLNALSYYDCL